MDADPSDDVYSAACVIHELLTGRHPFGKLATPQAAEEKFEPAAIASLSDAQNSVLRKALCFRRSERIATISELRQGLLEVIPPGPEAVRARRTWNVLVAGGVAVTVLVVVSISSWLYLTGRLQQAAPATAARGINPSASTIAPSGAGKQISEAANSPASTFEHQCGFEPSTSTLDSFIGQGLKAQTVLALAEDRGMRADAAATVRKAAECIRALAPLGFESAQGRAWLAEADASLAASR